ncbi:hypothetical protein [Streptomyces sp. NPDC017949]|uniref:hypothetical protein n=1 Tax=Streptomyces sp. NPDC017949 TaxID=3365020 RepID=UPI0037A57266
MSVPPFRHVVSAVAAACLSALLVAPAAQASGPAPDDGGELLVLSNEEYAQRFGDQCAPTGPAHVVSADGAALPHVDAHRAGTIAAVERLFPRHR